MFQRFATLVEQACVMHGINPYHHPQATQAYCPYLMSLSLCGLQLDLAQ